MSTCHRCPRFDSCNANVCPLDPQWPRAEHRQGERVCGLLTELAKVDGQAQVATVLSPEQFDTLVREWPKVEARWSDIRYRLKNAAKTGSRIANAKARFHTQLQGMHSGPLPQVFPEPPSPDTEGASVGGGDHVA